MGYWSQTRLLDPKTEATARLVLYHDLVIVVVARVLVLVGWFLIILLGNQFFMKGMWDQTIERNETLEVVWTVAPRVVLTGLGFVSLRNLYRMEVGSGVVHSVEATGHQWYWDYRYVVNVDQTYRRLSEEFTGWALSVVSGNVSWWGGDVKVLVWLVIGLECLSFNTVKFESYLVPESALSADVKFGNGLRLAQVTNPCFLCLGEKNEVKICTADVIHRWGLSEFRVKADAVPGRLNCVKVHPWVSGFSYGMCYELCGAGHRNIPIVCCVRRRDVVQGELVKRVVEGLDWDERFRGGLHRA